MGGAVPAKVVAGTGAGARGGLCADFPAGGAEHYAGGTDGDGGACHGAHPPLPAGGGHAAADSGAGGVRAAARGARECQPGAAGLSGH